MGINIFEGARRIAILIAALWIVGGGLFLWKEGDPYITATYTMPASGGPPVRSDPSCLYRDNTAREDITVTTHKGTRAEAVVCFSERTNKFMVTSPSGQKYEVTAPEGASEQQVLAYAQSKESEYRQRYIAELETALRNADAAGDTEAARKLAAGIRKARENKPVGRWDAKDVMIHSTWPVDAYKTNLKETFTLSQADEEWIDDQWWSRRWEQVMILVGGLVFMWLLTWTIGWIVRGFLGIPRGQDHRNIMGAPE